MKNSIFIIVSLILLYSCSNEIEHNPVYFDFSNDWEAESLYGKIHTLTVYKANVSDFKSGKTENPVIVSEKEYSEGGYYTYEVYYDGFGNVQSKLKYEYNAKNEIINLLSENLQSDFKSDNYYEYDEKGNNTVATLITADTSRWTLYFEYDSLQNIIKTTSIQYGDTSEVIYEYEYNQFGNIISKKHFEYTPNGTDVYINEFAYDSNQKLIETINKSDFFGTSLTTYHYDSRNRLERLIFYDQGNKTKELIYDLSFNISAIRHFENDILTIEFNHDYTLDKKGNWTSKKVFRKDFSIKEKDSIHVYTESREIKYY